MWFHSDYVKIALLQTVLEQRKGVYRPIRQYNRKIFTELLNFLDHLETMISCVKKCVVNSLPFVSVMIKHYEQSSIYCFIYPKLAKISGKENH